MAVTPEEYDNPVFHAPHPGFFLGDEGPISRGELLPPRDDVPRGSSLGKLDALPLEILHQILRKVDICALVAIRNTNQRGLRTVESMLEFKTVAVYPRALSAMIRIRNRFADLSTLAACITDTQCSDCDQYGDYIYLITARRVCYPCFRSSAHYVPLAREMTRLPDDRLRTIPHIYTTPGRYGILTSSDRSFELYDQRHVEAEYVAAGLSIGDIAFCNDMLAMIPHSNRKVDPVRYMAVIPGPYFDETSQALHRGFCCPACEYNGDTLGLLVPMGWGRPTRRYTRDGLRQHIESFGGLVKQPDGTYGHPVPKKKGQAALVEFGRTADLVRKYEIISDADPPERLNTVRLPVR